MIDVVVGSGFALVVAVAGGGRGRLVLVAGVVGQEEPVEIGLLVERDVVFAEQADAETGGEDAIEMGLDEVLVAYVASRVLEAVAEQREQVLVHLEHLEDELVEALLGANVAYLLVELVERAERAYDALLDFVMNHCLCLC